jgi:hypothetical protein
MPRETAENQASTVLPMSCGQHHHAHDAFGIDAALALAHERRRTP